MSRSIGNNRTSRQYCDRRSTVKSVSFFGTGQAVGKNTTASPQNANGTDPAVKITSKTVSVRQQQLKNIIKNAKGSRFKSVIDNDKGSRFKSVIDNANNISKNYDIFKKKMKMQKKN